MLQTITPEICKKLEKIGFQKDEINTIQLVHQLKTGLYSIDIKKLINRVAFENLSKGVAETFEKNEWSEENFLTLLKILEMKIVVDTNIFFLGLNPKSYYHPIIKGIYLKKYSLLISTSVLLEYEEILQKVFSETLLEKFWLFILASENIFFINPTFNYKLPFADAEDLKFVDCSMPIF
jgi:hypothetical protein